MKTEERAVKAKGWRWMPGIKTVVPAVALLSLGDVAQDNITKLRERYPEGFPSRHISSE